MKVTFSGNSCIVERQVGDPKFYGIKNAVGESLFLNALKKKLNSMGFDLVKKRMYKDGHLVDEMQSYLRSRKKNGKDYICIFSNFFAIRGANDDFNQGRVVLAVEKIS